MPLVAVYVTHSGIVALKELDEGPPQQFKLNNVDPSNDIDDWTGELTTDRFVKVIGNAFKLKGQIYEGSRRKYSQCDELLILVNQDTYPAINNMVIHANVHGYAKKCRVLPSLVARLSFVTFIGSKPLSFLNEGDFFSIIMLHDDGYELFKLEIVKNHNYQLRDCYFYNTIGECVVAYNELIEKGLINDAFFVSLNTEEMNRNSSNFSYGHFYGYSDFEMMLYQGGLEKLNAAYKGSNEVLDFPPRVVIRYNVKSGDERTCLLFEPTNFSVRMHPMGRIKGFRINYAPEIIFVNKFKNKRCANVLMPQQNCSFVKIAAEIKKYGIMVMETNNFDDSIFEYCDPFSSILPEDSNFDFRRFATRFDVEVLSKRVPDYSFDEYAREQELKNKCLVYTMRREGKREYISVMVRSKDDDLNTPVISSRVPTPMYVSFAGGKIFDGNMATNVVSFKEPYVFHDISKVIGLDHKNIKFDVDWQFSLTSERGAPCYTYNVNGQKIVLSPEYVLAVIFRVMKKNADMTARNMYFPYTVLRIDGKMFSSEQLNYVMIAAGMAELDVQRIDFI